MSRLTLPRLLAALALVFTVSACDSGPSGPGDLEGRVNGPALGVALLEVQGAGINGFEGRGSTQVYSARLSGRPGVHRVIVLDRSGGEMGFAITVDDRGMEGPVVTVIRAANTSNDPISAGGVTVALTR